MMLAALLVVLGLAAGIAAVELHDLRLGGVLTVPILAVYALYDPAVLPVFVVSVAAALGVLRLLHERTLVYGRTLLVAAVLAGAALPLTLAVVVETVGGVAVAEEAAFLGSVLPGVAAYNYTRLDADDRRRDVRATVGLFAGLVALGVMLVATGLADALGAGTAPVLLRSSSAVAALAPSGPALTGVPRTVAPRLATTAVLLAGLVVSEAVYRRWGVRLTGMIAAPLVAVFALRAPAVLVVYPLALAAVFAATTLVNRTTLLYGRVLLAVAVAAGVAFAAGVALVVPAGTALAVPGFTLLFTGVLAGIGGYNVHRLAVPERLPAVALSAAAVGTALVALVPFATAAADPLVASVGPLHLLVGAAVLAAAGGTARTLESLRTPTTEVTAR